MLKDLIFEYIWFFFPLQFPLSYLISRARILENNKNPIFIVQLSTKKFGITSSWR